MKRYVLPLLGTLLVGASTPMLAQESNSHHLDLSIGARVGTLGFGLEINKLLMSHLGVRVGGNYLKVSTTKNNNNITYDASAKLHAWEALIDLYPGARGSFHLTGGIMTNPVTVSGTGLPGAGGTFQIGDSTYSAADVGTLKGEVKYPDVGGYVGLGWGTPARKGGPLEFLFDIGVVIGTAKVALTATGPANTPGSPLANDLATQQQNTQNDIDKWAKVWPVLSLGFAYRF
jgi:hypothetical protein